MKIVSIFADKLFSFHFEGETENELKRLLNLWNDTTYIYNFIKQNQKDIGRNSIQEVAEQLIDDLTELNDILDNLFTNKDANLDSFFRPLYNSEYKIKPLSKQKGKKIYLRLYAIRIDFNCFVITGGAIKFTQTMQEREHTLLEFSKLEKCKQFLQMNDVFDNDSFFEFINE
jgi:hypothetical protein